MSRRVPAGIYLPKRDRREPLAVGLLGCGAVAEEYYAPALAELEGEGLVRVVALFDPRDEGVRRLAARFTGARRIEHAQDLAGAGAALAIVASPARFHAQQTVDALASGLHVLVEKPMAATVEEAEAMLAAARRADRLLAVGLFRRYFAATRMIGDVLERRLLGAVQSVRYSEGGRAFWRARSASSFEKSAAGGGVLMDLGVHGLDSLCWWLGDPTEVTYQDDAMGGLEANCRIDLRFTNGVTGTMQLSRDSNLAGQCVIECERGTIRWRVPSADRIQVILPGAPFALDAQAILPPREMDWPLPVEPAATYQQSFALQLVDVVDAVQSRRAPLVPGDEGIRSLRVIEQCYRRRSFLAMPWLGKDEAARAEDLSRGGDR